MSTYAIADAINKFADNFKYAIGAKNQIEKEKLAFEKEKFEFEKKKEQKEQCKHEKECGYEINGRVIKITINYDLDDPELKKFKEIIITPKETVKSMIEMEMIERFSQEEGYRGVEVEVIDII